MVNLIKYKPGTILDFDKLPPDLQDRIKQYAVIDILKDEAKAGIQANRIDIEQYIALWLKSKSDRTKQTYRTAIADFFKWLDMNGIPHPLLIKAEHVDRYIEELKTNLKSNSVRLKACGVASFYSTMKRYGHIAENPFHRATLPKKEYKKAIKTDQSKTIPVMTDKEYSIILKAIDKNSKRKGNHISEMNSSIAAARLLPAVRVMAEYGLRVGAIPTIERRGNYFTYTTKGGKSFTQDIKPHTLPDGKTPFKGYPIISIQKAFKRITDKLTEQGAIQYAYTCHDLRHYFAVRFYRETKDIVKLKGLMGHASLNITDIYLQSIGIK